METNVHSSIAIQSTAKVPAIKLWYLCRALDNSGSGCASINIKDHSISRTTLWRYVSNADLFRGYTVKKGLYTVYYHSTPKVAHNLELTKLGAIAKCPISHNLSSTELGQTATLLEALKLQNQSHYLTKMGRTEFDHLLSKVERRKRDAFRPHIPEPEEYFTNVDSSSYLSGGALDLGKGRLLKTQVVRFNNRPILYLNTDSFFGASQRGIAKRLKVSISTISRMLVKADKIQTMINTSGWHYQRHLFEMSENLGQPQEDSSSFMYRLPCSSLGRTDRTYQTVKLQPYLYNPVYKLVSCRHIRRELKKLNGTYIPDSISSKVSDPSLEFKLNRYRVLSYK